MSIEMKAYDFKQGTEEWFTARMGKLTASDAQSIQANGKGLKTLVYKKAAEILSGAREESYTNPDMERGNELEDLARSSYEMQTGNKVKQVGFCESDEHTGASPDGLIDDDGLVEIKCPRNYKYVEFLYTKKIDTGYAWQMQMQMLVTGRKWCDYAVFNKAFNDIIIVRVERDEAKIDKIKTGLENGISQINEIIKQVKG